MFGIKRVYEKPDECDGIRVLIDRLWPRGLKKEEAKIDHWMKEIAPSGNLRKWFAHKEEHWQEFKSRYRKELKDQDELLKQLIDFPLGTSYAKRQFLTRCAQRCPCPDQNLSP